MSFTFLLLHFTAQCLLEILALIEWGGVVVVGTD